ncbi:MAG: hypothetical protein ACKVON_15565 [Beijerinckiaceae bacterium]
MTNGLQAADERYASSIRRRVRLVALLEASREAGIEPLPTRRLHLIAYLANVLSPVWDMPSVDGSVLKRLGGPFYPDLQGDLDRLVGLGVVHVESLRHQRLDDDHYRLEGSYRLNPEFANPILAHLRAIPEEETAARFVRELILALSSLSDEEIDLAINEDATYSNPSIGNDNVIDFGEWMGANYSATAAQKVGGLIPTGAAVGASEKVHLYVRHLRKRLQGGR